MISGIKILQVQPGHPMEDPVGKFGVFDIFFGQGWHEWTRVRVKPTGFIEHVSGTVRNNDLLFLLMQEYLFG